MFRVRSMMAHGLTKRVRAVTAKTAIGSLIAVLAFSVPLSVITSQGARAATLGSAVNGLACDTDLGHSNITITPTHGRAFYVDGTSRTNADDIDSGYIGYVIGETSSASSTDIWVRVRNFSTGLASNLAPTDPSQTSFKISSTTTPLSKTETRTAFFSIKATNVNSWGTSTSLTGSFTHTVEVYSGDPSLSGSTKLRECQYTFDQIKNSITANTTNVLSNTVSNSAPSLGETFTDTLIMTTGTIGNGETPDFSAVWMSANPFSGFPVNALRLEHIRAVTLNASNAEIASCEFKDVLLIKNANTSCLDQSKMKIQFTFKVIGSGGSSVRIAPVLQIASGTQIKHTDPTSAYAYVDLSKAASKASASLTFSKAETHTVGSYVESVTDIARLGIASPNYYYKLFYQESITSTADTVTVLDYIVDSPTVGSKIDTTTVRISSDYSTWTAIVPSESNSVYYIAGPISITKTSPFYIRYTMYAPVTQSVDTTTVVNTFYGLLGSSKVGTTQNSFNITNPTQAAADQTPAKPALPATATTYEATSIESTTATINGNVTDVSDPPKLTYFRYSRISDSVTAGTVDSVTVTFDGDGNAYLNLTGLLKHTTYYFQIYQNTSGDPLKGGVLDFTTKGAQAVTDAASSITTTSGVINGHYVLNGETYSVYFEFASDELLTTDTRTITFGDRNTNSTGNSTVTGLTAGTTYYYRICVKTDAASLVGDAETVCGSVVSFTTTAVTPPPTEPTRPPVNITWPTPTPVNYPTPLSGTQLNAVATCNGAPISGSYVYSPVLDTNLAPGTYTLQVTFVPDAGAACSAITTTVQFVVKAPTVTITWPNPTPVQGPATLSPTQLNAVCSVPGTLTYDPALGTVLPAGTYTLKVTCKPTDPNLPSVSTTVPFVVVTTLPTITWQTPAPMAGPATLSPTQLNASCSVAGTLTYDPPLGTVFTAPGTYTLKVTCTPTDPKLPPVTTTVQLVITATLAPVKDAQTGPNTFTQGYVKWSASPNATNYVVDIRGVEVCKTTSTSCVVNATIGPKTPVTVTALNAKGEKAAAQAVYFNDKLLTAIVVNFATNSYLIDAKAQKEINRVAAIIKREGFTYVEITGHTDPRGGALNVPLSKNRSTALKKALAKLVPTLSFKDKGLSYVDPKAANNTAAGMATNRRSEGAVM